MDTPTHRALIILIALLAASTVALTRGVSVRTTNEAGIRAELPDAAGDWMGVDILFCQNPKCLKDFTTDQLADRARCPACGGGLDTANPMERQLLPKDTIIIKKRYTNANGGLLYAAIVMSGSDRASIHRPQLCLVGQGFEIVKSETLSVPDAGTEDFEIRVLDLARHFKDGNGTMRNFQSYYAYWFAGKGRETPYHIARMFWMGWDRIVHSVSYRWSYISVSGRRVDASAHHLEEARDFARDLHAKLELPPTS